MTKTEEFILQCPKCKKIKTWLRRDNDITYYGPPGKCLCGCRKPWNVLKEDPRLKQTKGFVKVISDKGYQYLHGPNFQENPKGWIKE